MNFIQKIWNPQLAEDGDFYHSLSQILGFKPKQLHFYKKAFTHRSSNIKDETGNPFNYERLEFLGDIMLGAVISNYLYHEVPSGDEGYLTKMRSKIVSREHLNELGKDLNLVQWVKSKIPKEQFGENIYGNVFEALIGAIYLDKGFKKCQQFIQNRVTNPYVDIEMLEGRIISYKSLLIEWCQKERKSFHYEVFDDNGNEQIKHFGVKLFIDDKVMAKARGTSKKKAEESASKRAYYALQNQINKKDDPLL